MKLEQPIKHLRFSFTEKLESHKMDEVYNFLKTNVDNVVCDENAVKITKTDIEELEEIKKKCIEYFDNKEIEYDIILKIQNIIHTDTTTMIDILDQFFKEPVDDLGFVCCEVKFVCYEKDDTGNGQSFVVEINIRKDNTLHVILADVLERDDNIRKKYESAMAMMQKIIKY